MIAPVNLRRTTWNKKSVLGACLGLAVAAACLVGLPGVLRADGAPAATQSATAPAAPSSLPANWQSLSQADFVALCESQMGVATGSALSDRSKVAKYAWTAWLNNPQKAAALTPDQLVTLGTIAVSGMSNADSALLHTILLRRFPTDNDVQGVSLTSLDRLTGPLALRLTLTKDQVASWLQSWVGGHNGTLSLQDAAHAWDLCHAHLPATAPVLQNLAQNMWSKYLQVKEGWDPLGDADVMPYYNRLSGFLPKAQQGPLCQNVWRRLNTNVSTMSAQLKTEDLQKVVKEIVPSAQVAMSGVIPLVTGFLTVQGLQGTLHDLSYGVFLISWFRHDPKFEGVVATAYQSVLASTISKLSQNTPVDDFEDSQPPELGKVFESDADRQQLRNLLTVPVLENRLAAAQILTWSSMYAQKRADWWKEVSAKMADPQADADTKAFWILVSGEIEETRLQESHTGEEPDIKWKRQSLDKALAMAQGEPMRLLVLEEFTSYYMAVHHGSDGVSLLTSVSGQFSPTSVSRIKLLQHKLQGQQAYLNTQAQATSTAAAKASQVAQLKDYQASLGRAQMDHNQKAVTKLQGAIANLQSQMQQSTP